MYEKMNFVNDCQDAIERRIKYAIVKGMGNDAVVAQRMRDFTWRNIAKRTFAHGI